MPNARAKPKSKSKEIYETEFFFADSALTGKLQLVVFVDQKVLRFQISMEHVVRVTESKASQQLVHERLYDLRRDFSVERIEIFLQVLLLTSVQEVGTKNIDKQLSCRLTWSQCSNTSVSFLSEWRTSYNLTMFLCLSSLSKQISRNAELGTKKDEKSSKNKKLLFSLEICEKALNLPPSSSSSSRTLFS